MSSYLDLCTSTSEDSRGLIAVRYSDSLSSLFDEARIFRQIAALGFDVMFCYLSTINRPGLSLSNLFSFKCLN